MTTPDKHEATLGEALSQIVTVEVKVPSKFIGTIGPMETASVLAKAEAAMKQAVQDRKDRIAARNGAAKEGAFDALNNPSILGGVTGQANIEKTDNSMLPPFGAIHKATPQVSPPLSTILSERGARYGKFSKHAQITQELKCVFIHSPNWKRLTYAQAESLEMIAHKIGRILNGDPNYADSWQDIAGYAKLVADLCEGVDN